MEISTTLPYITHQFIMFCNVVKVELKCFPSPSSGQPAVQAVDTAMGRVAATMELQPGSHHLLLHCHAARGQLVVANSGRQGGLALYKTN